MNHDLMADALRASACGLHACEAAVALVIDHRYWLTRADFLTGFVDTFPSLTDGSPMAVICWPEAIAALDRGQLPAKSGSSAWPPRWPKGSPSTSRTPSPAWTTPTCST